MIIKLQYHINCLWGKSIYLGKGKYFCFKCFKIYEHYTYRIGLTIAQFAQATKKMVEGFNSVTITFSKACENLRELLSQEDK